LLTKEEADMLVEPASLDQLLHPQLDPKEVIRAIKTNRHLATGLPASPGGAVGRLVFDA